MHTPATVPTWVSNNPLQESVSACLLARKFFDTAHPAGLLLA
jgi:hypothetical protein